MCGKQIRWQVVSLILQWVRRDSFTLLPLQSSWNCSAWVRTLHLIHLCWTPCRLCSVTGQFSSSVVVLILSIIEARTMISPWLATELLFKKVWLMSFFFFFKHRLLCECKCHRFEILCWLLLPCRRVLLNARAIFKICVEIIFFLASDYCWKLHLFSLHKEG